MSRTPHPVALTAAMLMSRAWIIVDDICQDCEARGVPAPESPRFPISMIASLASRLHRLAKGAARASLAECNGEMWQGQRAWAGRNGEYIAAQIEKYASRIDRAIAKISADLAPLAIEARRNDDARGFAILLRSTEPTRPLPANGTGGEWGI